MSSLRIVLLGSTRVEVNGATLALGRRKAIALLAYLAVNNHPIARDVLAALLWPDYEQSNARSALRQTLNMLRSALDAEILRTDRESVQLLESETVWVDVQRFQALLAGMQAHNHPTNRVCPRCFAPLTEAASLHNGAFMAGFTLRDSPGYDEWQSYQESRLSSQLWEILNTLVGAYILRRDYTLAMSYALRLLELDSSSESVHCYLMQIYACLNERAAALRQYEACQSALDSLGVGPQPFTQTLYNALKNGLDVPTDNILTRLLDVESAQTVAVPGRERPFLPPNNLPSLLTAFVPRPDEVALIAATLNNADCRLLSLVGAGGFGKTRLALQTAAEQMAHFADGAFFVSLVSVPHPDQLVFAIGTVLKIEFKGAQDTRDQLIAYLADKATLLIMDNFEHLLNGATLLDDLLQHAPRLKILVTSRERLDLLGEWIIPISGMSYPESPSDAHWQTFSAVQLFVQAVRRVKPNFYPEAHREEIVALCKLVEGVPLSLELAATWSHTLTVAQILQRVQQGVDFLTTTSRNVPERHRSLRVVFDQSWQLLSESEKQVLRRLAMFRGPFRFDSAAAITGGSVSTLAGFYDKSFFRQEGNRYNMHHLLRQYLFGHLQEAGEVRETQQEYLQFYVELSRAAAPEVRGANQIEWLDRLEDEHTNIHVAILSALEGQQTDAALEIEGNLWLFWQSRGHITEALGWIEQTLSQATNTNTVVYGNALHAAGYFSWDHGDYDKAGQYHHRALEIRQALNDQAGIGVSLNNLGILAWTGRRFEEALAFYEQSLATRRAIGFTYGEATVLRNMGIVFATIGDFTTAMSHYGQALVLFRQLNDVQGIAEAVYSMGKLAYRSGDYQQSRSYHEEALALNRQAGNYEKMAYSLGGLSEIAIDLGDYAAAQTMTNESLQLYLQINDNAGVARHHILQGWIAYYTQQIPEALELAEQAINLLQTMAAPDELGAGFLLKAKCLLKQGQQTSAVRTFGTCFSEALHLSDFQTAAEAALDLAHIAVQSRQAKWKNELLAVFWQLHKRSYNALLPRIQTTLARIHEYSMLQARQNAEMALPTEPAKNLSDEEMIRLINAFSTEQASHLN